MSDKSGIEWTEATWNPATGCTKVSPGCKFCYAKHKAWPRLSKNPKGVYTGRVFEDVQVHPERLDQPLRWTKPRMIFVNSMSDLFHEDIQDSFIDEVFGVMAMAPNHSFQVLTKRAERMREYCCIADRAQRVWDAADTRACDLNMSEFHPGDDYLCGGKAAAPWPLPNVWLGVSVENQETADQRIPLLIETPAAVRWLSCEPLLDSIDLSQDYAYWLMPGRIGWVVVGGESGPKARPMRQEWALDLRYQCRAAGVPFFMKQGSQANWPHWKDFDRWHDDLQLREYPNDR